MCVSSNDATLRTPLESILKYGDVNKNEQISELEYKFARIILHDCFLNIILVALNSSRLIVEEFPHS